MAILATKALSFYYPDEAIPALNNIHFSIQRGEFAVICGPSGSGKSTLLRLFKEEIAPHGKIVGEILYDGKPLSNYEKIVKSRSIGMVFQDPENQLVMDRVLEELIFGLENIGASTVTMRKKIAEMAHFFGIHSLLNKKVHQLSGGQKQLINLASVLLMEPNILLLDEPTSQLDPVAAKNFLQILKQMNEEFGITVIIVEHRLEEVFPLADQVLVLDQGKLIMKGSPREVINTLWEQKHKTMLSYLPSTSRLYLEHTEEVIPDQIPLSVKEGKRWIEQLNIPVKDKKIPKKLKINQKPVIELKNIAFQYEKKEERVLNGLSLVVNEGDWISIVGGNGTGKSTLLKIIGGIQSPLKGSIKFQGKRITKPNPSQIGYLPQNPKALFVHDTVRDHLYGTIRHLQLENGEEKLHRLISLFKIEPLMDRHPYDVSGGEMQKIALITVLLPSPKILLLDEPTKGIDPEMKQHLGQLLKKLQTQGLTIIMVTHDIEFAAFYTNICGMMFQGEITTIDSTANFFNGNAFYTTMVNRITRDSAVPEVLTVEEAREKW